jgi:murein DD-endopeptidase MepM/ murein hydrolase activator NlpD
MQTPASPENRTEESVPGRWFTAGSLLPPAIVVSSFVGAAVIVGAFQAVGADREAVPNHRYGSCALFNAACATIVQNGRIPLTMRETSVHFPDSPFGNGAHWLRSERTIVVPSDAERSNPAEAGGPVVIHAELGPGEDVTLVPGEEDRASRDAENKHADSSTVVQRDLAIDGDLRRTLAAAGISSTVTRELLKAVSFDPDFPRHPPAGSRLTLAYEPSPGDGSLKAASHLLYAILNDGRKTHQVFRYTLSDTMVAFLSRTGAGGAIVSLKDPIPGARVTSGYGWRVHPILGVLKFHKGVDYAAPLGTPVRAAAEGTIEEIGWHGQNGKYVRIRHGAHLVTTYSHLKGFAAGLKQGTQGRRGQVIAFVGQTGLATGPHLYYEVIVDNRAVRPVGMPIVVPVRLADSELAGFHHYINLTAVSH